MKVKWNGWMILFKTSKKNRVLLQNWKMWKIRMRLNHLYKVKYTRDHIGNPEKINKNSKTKINNITNIGKPRLQWVLSKKWTLDFH